MQVLFSCHFNLRFHDRLAKFPLTSGSTGGE
jgi:hypothetical protein